MMATKTITNAWANRTLPDIFYEEPGPIEEGMRQEHPIDTIKRLLSEHYQDRDDVFISNAVFISYDITNGNARVLPDLFIAFGVDAAAIRENLPNFWLWETGKAPDFVMEVASPSTATNDLGPKRNLYAQLQITEYWRFDPTGGQLYGQPLTGERLINGQYIPYQLNTHPNGSTQTHSQLLNLNFHWNGKTFDILNPTTGKTINQLTQERKARQSAEAETARLRQQLRRQEVE